MMIIEYVEDMTYYCYMKIAFKYFKVYFEYKRQKLITSFILMLGR